MELEEYLDLEKQISDNLSSIYVDDMPLWRIVRTSFRERYLGLIDRNIAPTINVFQLMNNTLKSFWGLTKMWISKKKYANVFLPHPRLYLVGKSYLERMSDPLIDYSKIGDNYIILERHQNGIHRTPRYHKEKVIYLDLIDVIATLLSKLTHFKYKRKYKEQIDILYGYLDKQFHLSDESYKIMFYNLMTSKLILSHLTKPLLKRIEPKRIFLATRDTYNYVISYAKNNGITTIELQHGVTVGETTLYSGQYDPKIDPDYFFTFGKANIGNHFSVPLDRIKNIGFAYKNYLSELGLPLYSDNTILVISELTITENLLKIIFSLADIYKDYIFHIRCHPQEKLTEDQLSSISKFKNVSVADNTIESFCAITQYTTVIGENSTVMYEAMSLHKKVGRLNYGGLHIIESEFIHGGYKINSEEDFKRFMEEPYSDKNDSKDVYSDFNEKVFSELS